MVQHFFFKFMIQQKCGSVRKLASYKKCETDNNL